MRHPKIAALSDAAFRLWVAGNDYCDTNLTDGIIVKTALSPRNVNGVPARANPKLITELTAILPQYQHGLWEDRGDHFKVHDYFDWNDSREVVQANRARARERAARWRAKRGQDTSSGNQEGTADDGARHDTNHDVTDGARHGARAGVSNNGIRDRDRDRDRDRKSTHPPTPSRGGKGRVSKRDLQRAADLRSKVYGRCPHKPPCEVYQDCIALIAQTVALEAS